MVLFRFLDCLCASDAQTKNISEKQTGCDVPLKGAAQAVEPAACQHDLAVSSLHRMLSGLTGTPFQRIDGLLEALCSPEITGASLVEFYAVPEGESDEDEPPLILLASARQSAPEADSMNSTTHLLPDPQQAAVLKRMSMEKAPVHVVLDRCADLSSLITTAALGTPGTLSSRHSAASAPTSAAPAAAAAAAFGVRKSRRTRIAAVPLLRGTKLAGALWLEQNVGAAGGGRGGVAVQPEATEPPQLPAAAPLLSDARALHSLGFACSMCMLGPDGSHAAWLAAVLARLGSSDTMSTLTSQLCAAVAAHVRRRFVLDGSVTAALVPPGPEAPPLALLLQPTATPAGIGTGTGGGTGTGTGGAGSLSNQLPRHLQLSLQLNGGPDVSRSVEGSLGSRRVSCSPQPGRTTASNVMLFAAQQLSTSPPPQLPPGLGMGPGTGTGMSAMDLGGGLSASVSKRGPRGLGGNGLPRDPMALIYARFSLDLSPRTRGGGGGRLSPAVHIPRSPSMGPTGNASSRSIVIPLANHGAADITRGGSTAGVAAAASSSLTPTLHAKAFSLQRTLLQAHLQHQQAQQRQAALTSAVALLPRALASAPDVGGGGQHHPSDSSPAAAAATAGGSVQAISAPSSFPAVIEDMQMHVQNVHKPSNDVCMLMGLTRKTANGLIGAGGGGGGFASGSHVHLLGAGGGGGATASASGMVGGGPLSKAAAGAAAAASVPQSLVLLAMQLGGGAVLGLYVCFPKRLPGPLLEAVRTSCQELVDRALGSVIRSKLKEAAIAPEYETLCCANPGSYAVLRSPSLCGSHHLALGTGTGMQLPLLPPSFSATSLSNATGSDLVIGMPAGEAGCGGGTGTGMAASAAAGAAELLSGELSTADMEVLLGLQAQQQAAVAAGQGQGRAGQQQQQHGPQDLSMKRGSASVAPRPGLDRGAAAASVVRRSIAAIAGGAIAASERGTGEKRALTASILGPFSGGASGRAAVTGGGGATAAGAGGAECMEPLNLSELLQSNPTDILAERNCTGGGGGTGQRTSSFRSLGWTTGLSDGARGGSAGFAAATIITVSGPDNAASAKQQLDLLVSSIHATMNTDPAAGSVSSAPMDDLAALELDDVLGQGGGGTVFKGKLGTLDVAVKLMELPKVESAADARKPATAAAAQPATSPACGAAAGGGGSGGGTGPTEAELAAVDKLCLNARREMLRNATELAVQSRVSHPNIVQIYATYNDVVMVTKRGPPGCPGSTYRLLPAAANNPGPAGGAKGEEDGGKERRHVPCVAAVFELCDCGSLGGALAARTFPKAAYRERERDADGPLRPRLVLDMKGVYMTLLDVALALRHLHSLNLVHRDVKPANLLLKSNLRDPRGFTVKLSDFGFVLHLSETSEDGTRYAVADQACGTVTHMAPEALLAKAKIDASVDIYAFGILMWEMFSAGVRPYPRLQPDKIPRAVYRGARPSFAEDVPSPYRNLAAACWSTDPSCRPRASDVVCLLNGFLQELESLTAGQQVS